MKRIISYAILATLLLSFGQTLSAQNQDYSFTLVNPLDLARPDEPFVLTRSELEKHMGVIPEGKSLLAIGARPGQRVQLDDLDGDGKWDEAFFICGLEPREKLRITIRVSDAEASQTARAHVRMKAKNDDDSFGPDLDSAVMPVRNPPTDFSKHRLPSWLTEGPGWENDKVAYRLYFDTRNNKDIYGKRVSSMVMEDVGAHPEKSYHELADWGMDILKVGGSLGAGALAFDVPTRGRRDTLIRLGGQNIRRETYHKIADGPLRAIFRMDYEGEINSKPVHIMEEISISGGQYFYSSKVVVEGAPSGTRLVTGIANFYTNEPGNFRRDDAALIYSYGKQSENKDMLGMAVLADKKDLANLRSLAATGSDVVSTYTLSQYLHKDKPVYFRFYTCWEKTDPGFAGRDYFVETLRHEADKYNQPVRIEP